jgi:DNA-binding MarR family transcriptional regulator
MSDRQDYSRSAGAEALGARLRRASERMDADARRIYAAKGLNFEQRWYGLINQLVLNGPMSIGDIAAALRITHVSVSQSSRSLEKAGIIASEADPSDGRRRRLSLTPKGAEVVAELAPLWQAFNTVAGELNAEAGNLVRLLDRLDDALERKSMFDRIAEKAGIAPADPAD